MGNCLFAYPDRTIAATLTGGSWQAALPLANLKNQKLAPLARSTNALLASTQFNADIGAAYDIRVLAIIGHNCTTAAQVRITGYSDSGYTAQVADTGWTLMIPTRYYPAEALPWGHPSFWDGTPTAEDLANITPAFYYVFPDPKVARYWRVEINDTANPAGYIQLSRCFMAPAWQPKVNMAYGAQLGYETDTVAERSLGGVGYFDVRPNRRVLSLRLDGMNHAQGLSFPLEQQRKLGIDKELFFVWDPNASTILEQQSSFLCTMRKLSPLEFPYSDGTTVAYELQEVL